MAQTDEISIALVVNASLRIALVQGRQIAFGFEPPRPSQSSENTVSHRMHQNSRIRNRSSHFQSTYFLNLSGVTT
jgi:hypothetical protein